MADFKPPVGQWSGEEMRMVGSAPISFCASADWMQDADTASAGCLQGVCSLGFIGQQLGALIISREGIRFPGREGGGWVDTAWSTLRDVVPGVQSSRHTEMLSKTLQFPLPVRSHL